MNRAKIACNFIWPIHRLAVCNFDRLLIVVNLARYHVGFFSFGVFMEKGAKFL